MVTIPNINETLDKLATAALSGNQTVNVPTSALSEILLYTQLLKIELEKNSELTIHNDTVFVEDIINNSGSVNLDTILYKNTDNCKT